MSEMVAQRHMCGETVMRMAPLCLGANLSRHNLMCGDAAMAKGVNMAGYIFTDAALCVGKQSAQCAEGP